MNYIFKLILIIFITVFFLKADEIQLSGTLRDFNSSHPDFELYEEWENWNFSGLEQNMVKQNLGADRKPIFNQSIKPTTTQTTFNQWYNDTIGVNQSMPYTITLTKQDNLYIYDSNSTPMGETTNVQNIGFFPLDNQLFGNEGNEHNYHMTYEVHSKFTYQGGETFIFSGDDDVWVFIDGKLAVDIGGPHQRIEDSISLDTLNLTVGESYDFDMFWAERHTTASNFKITTSIELISQAKPIAEYRFDACQWNGVLGEVKDSSGNNQHLNAINGLQTVGNGIIQRAVDFDNSNQRVQGDVNLTLNNELTLSVWIKTSTNQAVDGSKYTRVVELSRTGNSRYSSDLAYMPNGKTIRGWTTNSNNTRSTEVRFDLKSNGFHDGNWHLLTYTYNNGVAKLYVDANLKQTKTKDIGNLDNPKKITIGGYYNSTAYPFKGSIDEVQVFDKALNLDEIRMIKNRTGIGREVLDCANLYIVSGTTFQDENRNGLFDANVDVSLKNISVKLFNDSNNNNQYDVGIDTLKETHESDINGNFSFINLSSGKYLLMVDSNDSDIPQRYALNSQEVIALTIGADAPNNYFAFSKEEALPVNCVENALMFQNAPTDISYLDLANGNMFVKAENVTFGNINGAGFNKKDGYYWGFNHTIRNGTLSRVGKTSNGDLAVDHFNIPNLTLNSYTGDVDDNGHLYLKENRKTNVAVIDLDPSSDTYLTKLRNFNLGQNLSIADWAFNPQDDKLYAVTSTYMYKIEPSNGEILSVQDINITGSGGYGASFFDKDGFYYIYRNNSGEIFRIDVDAQTPQAVPFATGGVVSSNDGAMCTDVEIRFDFGDLPNNYATTLEKDGARHRIKSSEGKTHYLGTDVTTENNGKPSSLANLDEGDDGVSINGVSLQGYTINSKADISKEFTITTHGNGYLNAWIDWNRDGEFNSTEQIANGLNGSSGSINFSINSDDIPTIIYDGRPIYARFRYASQQELNATGTAPDGEVEDYMMLTPKYPTVSIEKDIDKEEGDNGETTNFTFHINLNQLDASFINGASFSYVVNEGTATLSDQDYANNGLSGSFTVSPISSDFNITVQVKGDNRVESDEKFYLTLYNPIGININLSHAVGTILNDDSLTLNAERVNSNSIDNATQERKEALYTQISGRDFNYAIVGYDKNDGDYNLSDMTIKVQLLDLNTSEEDNILYERYYYTGQNNQIRFPITNNNDLKIPRATRKAGYKLSIIYDVNGSLVHGEFNEAQFDSLKNLNGNSDNSYESRDTFAIRPATYKIELKDKDENNNSVTYETNNLLNLIAEHNYIIEINATQYNSQEKVLEYRQTLTAQLDSQLIFNDKSSCNDDSNISLNYQFSNGSLSNETFQHNNYGKYKLNIVDSNWTEIDQKNGDCILDDSSISANGNEKSGCNISSNIELRFQPYEFNMDATNLKNIHNNKNYLYMSNLSLSQKMGVALNTTIVVQGEEGTQLSNFTKSCMADDIRLQLGLKFSFISDEGESNNTDYTPPKSIPKMNGERTTLMPQQIINFNDDNNTNVEPMQDINIEDKFLDENNGSLKITTLYNMQKLFRRPTNPINVNFISLEINSSKLSGKLKNKQHDVNGTGNISSHHIFYFSRVASYRKHYPKTNKKHFNTPLFIEIFCKKPNDPQWCKDTMNLNNITLRQGHRKIRGWQTVKNHNSLSEGQVYSLESNNTNILTNYNSSKIFINGRIDNIETYTHSSEETIKATIGIDSDVWLRYNKKAIAGVPLGSSSYSVIIKNPSSLTGVGENDSMIQSAIKVEHNGKMSW